MKLELAMLYVKDIKPMQVFTILQALFLMPYLLVGLVIPMVLADPDSRTYASDLHTFELATVALFTLWLPVFFVGRWLAQRSPDLALSGHADWKIIFPATTRLFAIGAPLAFVVGLVSGIALAAVG